MRKTKKRVTASGKTQTIVSWKSEKKKRKRQQRRKKIGRFMRRLTAAALLIFALIFIAPSLIKSEPAPEDLSGPYRVLWVADGDTLVLDIDGTETSVRMIGIDAPESVHWDETKNVPEGKEASEYLKKYLRGRKVYLEYDSELTDKYDRTLAYVWLEDGKTMVQDELLKAGMAQTLSIRPNMRYTLRFERLQLDARMARAGFWAGTAFSQ